VHHIRPVFYAVSGGFIGELSWGGGSRVFKTTISQYSLLQGGPKKLAHFYVRLNFIRLNLIKY